MRRCLRANGRWLYAIALGWLSFIACAGKQVAQTNEVKIGLLVPFTGQGAAGGQNYEHAVLMIVDAVNAAGGINGKPITVLEADTRSSVSTALSQAEAMIAGGALAIIGPESPDAAEALLPILQEAKVPLISPFIGEATPVSVPSDHPWFRLAPSATAMGKALANEIALAGLSKPAVITASSSFDQAFAAALVAEVQLNGATIAASTTLDATSLSQQVASIAAAGADSIVLSSEPGDAAEVVASLTAVGQTAYHYYLSPLLHTPEFLENSIPKSLSGAVGIAPAILVARTAFAQVFSARWSGDQPLDGAFYYYDATALLVLALQSASLAPGGINSSTLLSAMFAVSSEPVTELAAATVIDWQSVVQGLAEVSAGATFYYAGLTGPMLLQADGSRNNGAIATWHIANDQIVDQLE